LTPTDAHLRAGLALFERNERLGAFDAVLAASAKSSGARALVSADAAFATVPGLTHVIPNDSGIAALLTP
jgi:predicted nucleic acid-binding protein